MCTRSAKHRSKLLWRTSSERETKSKLRTSAQELDDHDVFEPLLEHLSTFKTSITLSVHHQNIVKQLSKDRASQQEPCGTESPGFCPAGRVSNVINLGDTP